MSGANKVTSHCQFAQGVGGELSRHLASLSGQSLCCVTSLAVGPSQAILLGLDFGQTNLDADAAATLLAFCCF